MVSFFDFGAEAVVRKTGFINLPLKNDGCKHGAGLGDIQQEGAGL
jgi:hypothetical protein